ncbi:pyridoxal-dependent decarboxylase, exosortase A system-associated [Uliginosibacterium sediminicola]|uniref:Pyridoxal-dependent decarboxylase, exosortase A system-associated n=1 Tax=Uliginosibacterium sediminicola TaxID=2024550 RepID=A0ABU9YWT5_9RHOO
MTRPTLSHAAMTQFPLAGDELLVGGMPLTRLAERVGQTPFYAYDRQAISARIDSLKAVLPARLELHYAIKANPMPALVAHIASRVDGLDVASAGELRVALDAGMAAAAISFAGPGKRAQELRQAVAAGVCLNAESLTELQRLHEASQALGLPARVALRVNPDFELKSSGMRMGGGAKPFGIDAEAIPAALRRLAELELQFEGFHLYAGSQSLRAEALIEAQSASFELALRLAAAAPGPLRTLNLGGGFGVPYFPGEARLDLAPIADHLAALDAQLLSAQPQARLALELGRYLVAEAGVYVCRVQDIKQSRDTTFLITDGGLHQHLAASGNFGQVIRKNYPVLLGNKAGQNADQRYSVVGPLCTPLDVLGSEVMLPQAAIGDLFVVLQSGAYGASASPRGFLSHPDVIEVLI